MTNVGEEDVQKQLRFVLLLPKRFSISLGLPGNKMQLYSRGAGKVLEA